jgi:hypothetical protein
MTPGRTPLASHPSRRAVVRLGLLFLAAPTAAAALLGCAGARPRPVMVGVDACAHCRMTIADPRLVAEAVTAGGQVLVFDSVTCLIDWLAARPADAPPATPWVARFAAPDDFLPAETAAYTASPTLSGPMGGPALLAGRPDERFDGTPRAWATLRGRPAAPPPSPSPTR